MTGSFDVSSVVNALERLVARVRPELEAELQVAVVELKSESDALVPFLSGNLAGSGKAAADLDALVGGVGYDDPSAVVVHEKPGIRYRRGKSNKFLQKPHEAISAGFADRVADAFRRGAS